MGASFSNALSFAQKAVELDSQSPEAHTSLGRARYGFYDWDAAERAFLLALRLNTNYATAHAYYSTLLRCQGRFSEGILHARLAKELDPESSSARLSFGYSFFDARRF